MPRGTRPTEEQKAAREQLAEARKKKLERKKRTRRLIQIGGTLDSFGVKTPEQADQLMRELITDAYDRTLLESLGAHRTDKWPEDDR